jgi:hypothetical protein
MTTKLDKPLKRELEIDGVAYTITFSPEGIKIVEKGKRKGQEVAWKDLLDDSTGLSRSLNDSVEAASGPSDMM